MRGRCFEIPEINEERNNMKRAPRMRRPCFGLGFPGLFGRFLRRFRSGFCSGFAVPDGECESVGVAVGDQFRGAGNLKLGIDVSGTGDERIQAEGYDTVRDDDFPQAGPEERLLADGSMISSKWTTR